MKPDEFETLCESLYDLTNEQREGLLDLLKSRIWLYESANCSEFERVYEFDDNAIKIVLRKTPLDLLSYALKGGTEDFRKRFFKNMPKADAAKLLKKMEALGPIRMSQVNQAQEKILEAISALASAGEIELPSPSIPCVAEISATPEVEVNNDPGRLQARVLLTLSDSSLKWLIRGVEITHWVDSLWYLNDARLTRKVLAFCTPHLSNMLMNDFAERWKGVILKSATKEQLERGQRAMHLLLETLHKMADSQEIFIPNR